MIYFFRKYKHFNTRCIMKKIINKFLLVGYKSINKIFPRQPGFKNTACGIFTKKERR